MDCPVARFDAWDPILQRFTRPHGGGGCTTPAELQHEASTPTPHPRELLAKLRTMSPPTNLAALRVSGSPSDLVTPGGDCTRLGEAGASVPWWRTGGGSTGSGTARGGSGGDDGRARTMHFAAPSTVTPRAHAEDAEDAEDVEDAEEASRRLAMQLQQEEQATFLEEYAQKLTSPDNPVRRRARLGDDPRTASSSLVDGSGSRQMDLETGIRGCAVVAHSVRPRLSSHAGRLPVFARVLQTSPSSLRGSCKRRNTRSSPRKQTLPADLSIPAMILGRPIRLWLAGRWTWKQVCASAPFFFSPRSFHALSVNLTYWPPYPSLRACCRRVPSACAAAAGRGAAAFGIPASAPTVR